MAEEQQAEPISKKRVVYTMPGVETVRVVRDRQYVAASGSELAMDLYYPPELAPRRDCQPS